MLGWGFGTLDNLRLPAWVCFALGLAFGDLGADGEAALAVGVGAFGGAGVEAEAAAAGEGAALEGVGAFLVGRLGGGAWRFIGRALLGWI